MENRKKSLLIARPPQCDPRHSQCVSVPATTRRAVHLIPSHLPHGTRQCPASHPLSFSSSRVCSSSSARTPSAELPSRGAHLLIFPMVETLTFPSSLSSDLVLTDMFTAASLDPRVGNTGWMWAVLWGFPSCKDCWGSLLAGPRAPPCPIMPLSCLVR